MVVVSHLFLSLRKSFRGRFDSCESNLPLFGTIYFPTAPFIPQLYLFTFFSYICSLLVIYSLFFLYFRFYNIFMRNLYMPTCYNGSLEGIPAFLGYFAGVILIFLIFTSALPISVSGNKNLSVFSIFPPSIFTAFSAC